MAFPLPGDSQPQLWSTQPDGLESQVGGLFYNLDTQDALPDFQEPEKELWESQAQGWDDAAINLAKDVAEVALDESTKFTSAHSAQLGVAAMGGFSRDMQGGDGETAEPDFKDTGAAETSDDEAEPVELPPWSCAYCGNHTPATVAQCELTGKWFCNGNVAPGGTCIIQHLVRGRYKELRLHQASPLGNTLLECYHSGSRNVFALGFVPVKSDEAMVLLARDTPASAQCVKDLDLDLSSWQPIVQDRAIVPWLVQQPTKEECARARKLKASQMMQLETVWKSNPDATLAEVQDEQADQKDLLRVALRYEDAYEYQNVLAPLVQIEADYDKACREALRKENLRVTWEQLDKRWVAKFVFPRDDESLHVMLGDELILQHETAGPNRSVWEMTGVVIQITLAEELAVELHSRKGQMVPTNETTCFAAELTWNSTAYDRMQAGLKTFAEHSACMSDFLYHQFLGHEPACSPLRLPRPSVLQAPGMPTPNHSQLAAIEAALQQPFTMIQGPPGTGKTVTSATLVWLLAKATKDKILVAAPSNVAVDHLAEKIAKTGLKVVRLASQRAQVSISREVEPLTLHYQVANLKVPGRARLQKLLAQKRDKGELSLDAERQLHHLWRTAETELLREADVVCVTCIGAGDKRLKRVKFPRVLIDESTQATEPECLLPLTLGAQQAVLVGDHCQLGPIVMNKLAEKRGLSQSLVERMILCGCQPQLLQVQYRMHPALSEFPSNTFYDGALQNGVTEAERLHPNVGFPWPDPNKRLMFYQQRGTEEISSSGTSYVNRVEASAVEKVVTCLLSFDVKPDQIGVITPYEGQRAQIVRTMEQIGALSKALYAAIEVASVDAFQGREKDYIIFSCVRSSQLQGIGFLSEPRRLNVALTRARFGCVIVGNANVLCKQALWHSLLSYVRDRGLLVDGPLTNLVISHTPLPKPERVFDRRGYVLGFRTPMRYRPTEYVEYPNTATTNGAANGVHESDLSMAMHSGRQQQRDANGLEMPPPLVPPPPPPPQRNDARAARSRYAQFAAAANPFAVGPVLQAPGAMGGGMGSYLSQEGMSIESLSQRGLSLATLGQHMSQMTPVDASQNCLASALPEFSGLVRGSGPQPPPMRPGPGGPSKQSWAAQMADEAALQVHNGRG